MAGKEFENEIKSIEQRLLEIKTASTYSSIRTTQFTASAPVSTGLYRITYSGNVEDIFSTIYCGASGSEYGFAYARTPNGNTQIVEVLTDTYTSSGWITFSAPLVVVSNTPVTSITRIS